jgi:hypothetical protein
LYIGLIRVAAVVAVVNGAIVVMRFFLAVFHVHVAEPGLQRLGADGQDKDENQ